MTTSSTWRVEPLSKCVTVVNDKVEPSDAGDLPYIGLEHIEKVTGVLLGLGSPSDVRSTKTRFMAGDVLYGKLRPYLSKVLIAPTDGVCSTDILALRARDGVSAKYIYYRLRSGDFVAYASANSKGVNLPRVSPKVVGEFPVSLPALDEQERIVARIEELMSDVDAADADIKQAASRIAVAQVAVVEQAVNGTMTAACDANGWRDANTANAIAEHIQRRRNGRRVSPTVDVSGTLFTGWDLPSGWAWTSLDALAADRPNALKAGPFGSALKKSFYVTSGYKVYGQEQVIRGDASYGDYYIDEARFRSLESCSVDSGDILVSLVGTIGRVLILPPEAPAGVINPRLVKFTLADDLVESRYIALYLRSPSVRRHLLRESHGGTMDVLNLTTLRALPIALPPLPEQRHILARADATIANLGRIAVDVESVSPFSQALRQSILKSAFSGGLV